MICNKILKPNYGALENCCSVELQQSVCDENRDDEWFKKSANNFEGSSNTQISVKWMFKYKKLYRNNRRKIVS